VFHPHTAVDCTEEEWDDQIDVNLKGVFLMSREALPVMIRQKSGPSSTTAAAGDRQGDAAVAYCASRRRRC
jgi:NAD(P)-dependent dehydrogenase (short-subunit alcohol dehydrogenase family)